MSKYRYDDDEEDQWDPNEDEDDDDEEEDEEFDEEFDDPDLEFEIERIEIANREINEQLLNDAIEICSKSWFWYFRKIDSKLEQIKKTYSVLKSLTDQLPTSSIVA